MLPHHIEEGMSQVLRDTNPELWQALWRRIEAGDTPRQILKALRPTFKRMRLLTPSLPGLIEATVHTLYREKREPVGAGGDGWELDW